MSPAHFNYRIILPRQVSNANEEWADCLSQIQVVADDNNIRIVKLHIFTEISDGLLFERFRNLVRNQISEIFHPSLPAFSVIPQSPERPFQVAVEVGCILHHTDVLLRYECFSAHHYVLLKTPDYHGLWVNGLGDAGDHCEIEKTTHQAFRSMVEILDKEGFSIDNLVRQWNYIGNITQTDRNEIFSHYQIFNKVRHTYYGKYKKKSGYPAATGIGMNLNGVLVDFHAFKPMAYAQIIPVENPRQQNAYQYGKEVLGEGKKSKMGVLYAPLFERAKLVASIDTLLLFVSGTASILGQATIGEGDITKQTFVTLENIRTVCSEENLRKYSSDLRGKPMNYKKSRVFVRKQEHIPLVRKICNSFFGNSPILYLQADICREELLVEIETELQSS